MTDNVLAIPDLLERCVTLEHAPMTVSDMGIVSMAHVIVAQVGRETIVRRKSAPMVAVERENVLTPPVSVSQVTLALIVQPSPA